MLTRLALAAAVLTLAAMPDLLPARATPEPEPLPAALPAAASDTFTPLCVSGTVDAGRPQPAWLRQSFIGDRCQAPPMPAEIDGYAASREEIVAGMEVTAKYQRAANEFESCVAEFVADGARKMSRSEAAIQEYRITVSRQSRLTAKLRMEAAIMAFNEYGSGCTE